MIYRCPTCKSRVKSPTLQSYDDGAAPDTRDADSARFFPFCSQRCKLIDLGAWLKGAYKIPSPVENKDETVVQDAPDEARAHAQKAKKTL